MDTTKHKVMIGVGMLNSHFWMPKVRI